MDILVLTDSQLRFANLIWLWFKIQETYICMLSKLCSLLSMFVRVKLRDLSVLLDSWACQSFSDNRSNVFALVSLLECKSEYTLAVFIFDQISVKIVTYLLSFHLRSWSLKTNILDLLNSFVYRFHFNLFCIVQDMARTGIHYEK